jgi:hypothetical protein
MPVQLVLLFVALAALDLACQVLGALLVHYVPALVRDAARLGSALFLSAVMIAAYRWLVRSLERRSPDELGTPLAARWLAVGATAGAALFGVARQHACAGLLADTTICPSPRAVTSQGGCCYARTDL